MNIFHKVFFRYSSPKKHIKSLCIIVFILLVTNVFALLNPAILSSVLDSISHSKFDKAYQGIFLFIVCSVLLYLTMPYQHKYAVRWLSHINYDYHIRWIELILKNSFSFFNENKLGSLLQAVNRGLQAYAGLGYSLIVMILPGVVRMMASFLYLVYFSGIWLTLTLTVCAALLYFVMKWGLKKRAPYIQDNNNSEDVFSGDIVNIFQSARMVKLSDSSSIASDLLRKSHQDFVKKKVRLSFATHFLVSIEDFVIVAGSAFVLFVATFLMSDNGVYTSGDFLAIFLYSFYFIESMAIITDGLQEFELYLQDSKDLDRIIDAPNNFLNVKRLSDDEQKNLYNNPIIHIKPFELSLSKENATILTNKQSLLLKSKKIAITGPSGQGKTSLCEMIARINFFDVCDMNHITISNIKLSDIPEDILRNLIYFSEHKPCFLSGNLLEALALPSDIIVKDDQLKKILVMLELHRFLYLVEGVEDKPSFKEKELSNGEKKRFSLMRAMLLNRQITIIDEPTEGLDSKIAGTVWKNLFYYFENSVLICITHDEKILNMFDEHIRIDSHKLKMVSGGVS
ncbi:MAG: ABC transporter ATP-binding protein [Proteobacteria bacterium]|nr:ABC transporter ATP-binding protein [Pseudomonadota bacterium]